MKVSIVKTGINGEGIGYIDHTPVFVPEALVNEVVDITVVEKKKRYMRGKLNRILVQSEARKKPKCRIQNRCGGCALMIADYNKQLEYKYEILKQSLIKYAQINPALIEKIKGSKEIFGYRNQCKLPCSMEDGRLTTGMYLPNSNYFCEVDHCVVHDPNIEQIRNKVMDVCNQFHYQSYDYHQKKGIRSLIIRGFANQYQVSIVSGAHPLEEEAIAQIMKIKGVVSLWQSYHTEKKSVDVFGKKMIHLAGEKLLPLEFDGLQLKISPRSFFQLNTEQAKVLYREIANMVEENNELIVEAYSGIGAISLYVKDKAKKIIGIEVIKDAVVNANENAKLNHAENIHFVCADAAEKLTYISKKEKIDILIVDPPRTGLDDEMLYSILHSKIKKMIYISCNPATLGKDLSILKQRYQVKKIQPIDMFPHTPHVESVVLLQRVK